MSATLAPSAAPPCALRIWADARYIYVELPNKSGPVPCVLSFTRSTVGLSKALAIVYGHAEVAGSPVNPVAPARKLVGTPAQHSQAEAILRRAGVIK